MNLLSQKPTPFKLAVILILAAALIAGIWWAKQASDKVAPKSEMAQPITTTTPNPTQSIAPTPTPTPAPVPPITTATTDTHYDLGVLVLEYFPLTADKHLDLAVTGDVGEPYDVIKQRATDITAQLKISLEKASTYLGDTQSSAAAKPALTYTIVDTKEFLHAVPIKPTTANATHPDYNGLLTDAHICDYVTAHNVKEVWLWAYQGPTKPGTNAPYLGISESKMSGPSGDISNSFRENDMPKCGATYRVYTFNYGRYTAEALESWGHQLEAEMDAVDRNHLYREAFQGPAHPSATKTSQPGRCGSVHNPPNARFEYDRDNPTPNQSDCLAWNPNKIGTPSPISCANWGCELKDPISDNPSLNYQIWMLQHMPGRGNTKTYAGRPLRNWWDIHGDFDGVMKRGEGLTLPK